MNWKTFITGLGTGLATGIVIYKSYADNRTITAETALELAKKAFKKHGPIEGSWIHMEKQTYTKLPLQYEVYIGGITRTVDNQTEQYEFVVDTATGAILDAYLL